MDSDDLPSPRKRATSPSLATIIILCIISCKLLVGVHAFAPQPLKQTCIVYNHQNRSFNHITRLHASIDDVDDDESDALLNELRDKKKDAFGKDIPSSDELEQAAKNAENSFLAAMLEQSQTFKEIKSEKGGDAAVSEFRRRIQEGDEAQRLEDAKAAAEESGEESMDKKWFVQQMEEGIMEEVEEEIEDDWQ